MPQNLSWVKNNTISDLQITSKNLTLQPMTIKLRTFSVIWVNRQQHLTEIRPR